MEYRVDRVVYYSAQDMTSGYMLDRAENILKKYQENTTYSDINDIIELYQIKRYIDADLFLEKWGETERALFKTVVVKFWTMINIFSQGIDDSSIETYFAKINWQYFDAFWQIVDKCKVYNRISTESFQKLLNDGSIGDVLEHKNLVNHYNTTIREFLITYERSAEIILSKYEEVKDSDTPIYLPQSLTQDDKVAILDQYLDWEDANLNWIRLIVIAKKSPEFNIPDIIRLKAKRRDAVETEEMLRRSTTSILYQISFSEEQSEPAIESCEGESLKFSYSAAWIKKHCDTISLFKNFRLLFGMLDQQYRISLVSKRKERGFIDMIGLHSQNGYEDTMQFQTKNDIALRQIYMYARFLEGIDICLEDIIEDTFNGLTLSQNINNLSINFPSKDLTRLEKIRFLLPEMESLMKKYKLYIENGVVDHELLSMSSTPCQIQDLPSAVEKKYVYGVGSKIREIQHHFFSDQSMLYYVKPHNNKYHTVCELLLNENVKLEDLENYQLPIYQQLISEKHLTIENDYIKLNKPQELAVYKELYENEFISYHHLTTSDRDVIDKLHEDGHVEFESTLMSKDEANYFKYYLNKSEYTNGKDLRNKYAHGTNDPDGKSIENDYYRILILLVLLESKIIDDIMLSPRFTSINNLLKINSL